MTDSNFINLMTAMKQTRCLSGFSCYLKSPDNSYLSSHPLQTQLSFHLLNLH